MNQVFDQFEMLVIDYTKVFENYAVMITNFDLTVLCLLLAVIIYLLFFQYLELFKFTGAMILSQIGNRAQTYILSACGIFTAILFANLLGIVPGNLCITAQLYVTLTFSSFVFFGVLVYFLIFNGIIEFLKHFIPKNAPVVLTPFLTVIELISYCSRLISLAVRLFANMVAGHSLLKILLGFFVQFLNSLARLEVTAILFIIIPFGLISSIYILEVGIAFLQAYVFAILFCIYLRDVFEAH